MTERKDTSIDDLFWALDIAAVDLLRALPGKDYQNGIEVPMVSLADRTKVFGELVAYATLRAKAVPPKPPKPKTIAGIASIRGRFHGEPGKNGSDGGDGEDRRGGDRTSAKAIAGEGGSA